MFLLLLLQVVSSDAVGSLADQGGEGRRDDTTTIMAQIPPICTVDTDSAEIGIDPQRSGEQSVGTITYTCNAIGGFTRRITSANNGSLRRGAQDIAYFISQTGTGALELPRTRLTSPVVSDIPASAVLTTGSSEQVKIEVPTPTLELLAGEYRDTVSIEISPN